MSENVRTLSHREPDLKGSYCHQLNMAARVFRFQQTIKVLAARNFPVQSCRFFSHGDRNGEHLSSRVYWKQKYKGSQEDAFDWFLSHSVLSGLVDHALSNVSHTPSAGSHSLSTPEVTETKPVNVLDLGCGKSLMPKCLYEWKHFPLTVYCLDYIQDAVEFQLGTLQTASPGHTDSNVYGVCASVCQLPFHSRSFKLVTDKGTMDALLKNSTTGVTQAREMLCEVHRVLQDGGVFMQITDEDPDSRLYVLETNSPSSPSGQWTFSVLPEDEDRKQECFVYMFHK
ncbi:hypothetical protein BaRGS_00028406 [Batillaria attramentaria]|uniref:Methyltransferase type 11 domain-containing protein n=1 Tax=Batillaria attramentaria TaxID=370345 RepID=A0ABD0K047_9CAEN